MPPSRPRAFAKEPKSKKVKEPRLNDADDYLAAASEHEDAMGKHRGGDAAKSLRFARRALDVYSQGLAKFPQDFDLAYNKARLQLEVATHPSFSEVLDIPIMDLLRQTLDSHQYAVGLDSENADALFNMAQVLTTLAENIAEDDRLDDTEALQLLEQALDYQGRCFAIQQKGFIQSRLEFEQAMRENASTDPNSQEAGLAHQAASVPESQNEESEQWVSVVEPVTADTLLDTIIAQVSTLTTVCSIVNTTFVAPGQSQATISLSWIESFSRKLLAGTLDTLLKENRADLKERLSEIALARAVFTGAFLELSFRSRALDAHAYKRELDIAFSQVELDHNSDEVLIACARALISFNACLAESDLLFVSDDTPDNPPSLRWSILIEAQSRLTAASKLPGVSTDNHVLATTHLLRGDVSLLLHAISYPPRAYTQAHSTKGKLLKNAEVYYRNAGKLFGTLGPAGREEKVVAELKGGIVKVLQQLETASSGTSTGDGKSSIVRASPQQIQEGLGEIARAEGEAWVKDQLDEIIDEGLVNAEIFGL
ncbi:hypothetical protein F5X99DRAFT_402389 [Biscogniauxia marginata]|nr:hypothetical protein F5X99DRAFT_402389 [Biscogniauxia marginata]